MIMISRDRVNVPRDMTIWAARRLREALEVTAALAGNWGRENMMMRGPDDVIKKLTVTNIGTSYGQIM